MKVKLSYADKRRKNNGLLNVGNTHNSDEHENDDLEAYNNLAGIVSVANITRI